MRSLIRVIRSLIARTRFERDMREELGSHLEHRADDLVASGLSREDACRQARLEFGALESYKEQCRDAGGLAPGRVLHGFGGDLKLAARRLAATPLFTLFAVVSIAIGVGVTTAVYSSVERVLWRDVAIPERSRVVVLVGAESGAVRGERALSIPDFEEFRDSQQYLEGLSAARRVFPAVTSPAGTVLLPGEGVDERYFHTLGVAAALGRVIVESDVMQRRSVVVLGHALWRTRFGSDPGVIGRSVRVSGRPLEVVGVAPPDFQGPLPGPRSAQLWFPITIAAWFERPAVEGTMPERDRRRLTAFGRIRPGISVAEASAEVERFAAHLDDAYPRHQRSDTGIPVRRGWRLRTVEELDHDRDLFARAGVVILVLVGLVLLVACTNLSNLVLARGTQRQSELAVRRALGASRWRLVREQMAENLLLAAGGAFASYVVLRGLMTLLDFEIPVTRGITVSAQPQVDTMALAVAATSLLAALAVFGLEPALRLTARKGIRDLGSTAAATPGMPSTRRQRRLIRWQVAISAAFFVIASLCVRYLAAEARHDPGIRLDGMAVAVVNFYAQGWSEDRARRAIDRLVAANDTSAAVAQLAASTGLPFGTTFTPSAVLSTPDRPITADADHPWAHLVAVTPNYFAATGTRLLSGRAFDRRDDAAAPKVVIVSESAALQLFGTRRVDGRRLLVKVDSRGYRPGEEPRLVTVIGVAGDVDTGDLFSRRGHTLYMPLAQEFQPLISIVGRAEAASAAVQGLHELFRRVDPDLAMERVGTAHALLAGPHVFARGAAAAALSLGALTLLLAMAGLFAVQTHVVSHRTREIGVRMSFGATDGQIRAMVLKDGYGPVLQGLAIGLFIGVCARALVQSQTAAPIGLVDRWMLLIVSIPLLLAALFACWLPAHRASRVDPNVALRHL